MKKLGILFGGKSGEHEVSLMSATSVINAVDRSKFSVVMIGITKEGKWLLYDGPTQNIEDGSWQEIAEAAWKRDPDNYKIEFLGEEPSSLRQRIDFALPILHGPYGEDGTIQGLFEMLDIPYGGCAVTGSALAMDKIAAKQIFGQAGLPQSPYVTVFSEEFKEEETKILDQIENRLKYPIFVKPANLGSSVGITKVRDREQLKGAIFTAGEHDRRIVVEQGVECREIEIGILGNQKPQASGIGEIIPSAEFYDYTAKYFDGGKSKLFIPAEVSKDIEEEISRIAVEAYLLLDCCGFARIDFFLEKATNRIFINEINTIPGFTKFSMFPLLWGQAGLAYPDLIERIVTLGYERHHAKNSRQAALRIR